MDDRELWKHFCNSDTGVIPGAYMELTWLLFPFFSADAESEVSVFNVNLSQGITTWTFPKESSAWKRNTQSHLLLGTVYPFSSTNGNIIPVSGLHSPSRLGNSPSKTLLPLSPAFLFHITVSGMWDTLKICENRKSGGWRGRLFLAWQWLWKLPAKAWRWHMQEDLDFLGRSEAEIKGKRSQATQIHVYIRKNVQGENTSAGSEIVCKEMNRHQWRLQAEVEWHHVRKLWAESSIQSSEFG